MYVIMGPSEQANYTTVNSNSSGGQIRIISTNDGGEGRKGKLGESIVSSKSLNQLNYTGGIVASNPVKVNVSKPRDALRWGLVPAAVQIVV